MTRCKRLEWTRRLVWTGVENVVRTFSLSFFCAFSILVSLSCLSWFVPLSLHTIQTSMLPAGFKPAIPSSDRPQTLALDRSATGTVQPVASYNTDYTIPAHVSFPFKPNLCRTCSLKICGVLLTRGASRRLRRI